MGGAAGPVRRRGAPVVADSTRDANGSRPVREAPGRSRARSGAATGHATVRMRPGTMRIAAALPIRGVLVVAMALRCRLLRADVCHSLCANPRLIHGELREERPSGRVILVNHGSEADSNSTRRATPAQQPLLPSIHVARQWTTATAVVVAYVALEWVSFIHEFKGLPLTPWNPGLGLTFACLMLAG